MVQLETAVHTQRLSLACEGLAFAVPLIAFPAFIVIAILAFGDVTTHVARNIAISCGRCVIFNLVRPSLRYLFLRRLGLQAPLAIEVIKNSRKQDGSSFLDGLGEREMRQLRVVDALLRRSAHVVGCRRAAGVRGRARGVRPQ